MKAKMDTLFDRPSPITSRVPCNSDNLEEISGMSFIDLSMQRVVYEIILGDPSPLHDHFSNDGRKLRKDLLNDAQASECSLDGFHKARPHQTRVESSNGSTFTLHANAVSGTQRLQKSQKGSIVGQCRIDTAAFFVSTMLLHQIVNQALSLV